MELRSAQIQHFQDTVMTYYDQHGRHDLPWRLPDVTGFDPYKVVVSELMLQQTQVARVITKYAEFLARFPDVQTLAAASLGDVLVAWQGLGYNRRAKFLWQTAGQVQHDYAGAFPDNLEQLVALPGIGTNTAGAVLTYAFNKPTIFIETNVRTVYIHHFFPTEEKIDDKEIRHLLEQTILHDRPRDFYWALMDYGTYLKKHHGNASVKSRHYTRQTAFEGSRRQVRGKVLRLLGQRQRSLGELADSIADERLEPVLGDLKKEGMIYEESGLYRLA